MASDFRDKSPTVLSVIVPCLNEEKTLRRCLEKAVRAAESLKIPYELIVVDNGSRDRSAEIAHDIGARLISVAEKGYGNALLGGFKAAQGEYLVMADADDSYDFLFIPNFFLPLTQGADYVIGNRFQGGIEPGAMPALNRLIGNPLLTALTNLFFGLKLGDSQCGFRGVKRSVLVSWDLSANGMELASEMNAKAALSHAKVIEVPTHFSKDGRGRRSHLRPFRDGFRHIFLMAKIFLRKK